MQKYSSTADFICSNTWDRRHIAEYPKVATVYLSNAIVGFQYVESWPLFCKAFLNWFIKQMETMATKDGLEGGQSMIEGLHPWEATAVTGIESYRRACYRATYTVQYMYNTPADANVIASRYIFWRHNSSKRRHIK